MTAVRELGPGDLVADRPFTHPDNIREDARVLHDIAEQLCHILTQPLPAARPVILHRPGPEGHDHRLVLVQPDRLRSAQPITVVGFFGQRRESADPESLHPLDDLLVAELPDHPHMLSYCTLKLPCSNYGNLVLFARPEGKRQWSRSRSHAQAVNLAPGYYASVRIYHGTLPVGLDQIDALRLTIVKYYDYRTTPLWQAVRHVEG